MWITEYLASLNLSQGGRYRGDCPKCGGKNTFNVNRDNDKILFNCYRNSCTLRGVETVGLSKAMVAETFNSMEGGDSIPTRLFNRGSVHTQEPTRNPYGNTTELLFLRGTSGTSKIGSMGHSTRRDKHDSNTGVDLSKSFSYVFNNRRAQKYLQDFNLIERVKTRVIKVAYDPKRDRIVFLIQDDLGDVVDACGRLLLYQPGKPKWYRYANSGLPFVVHKPDNEAQTAIVVEDCTSAAVASYCTDAVALMGTSLHLSYIPVLKRYKKLYVCLDADAYKKAFAMQRELSFYTTTEVIQVTRDFKYLKPHEITKLIGL